MNSRNRITSLIPFMLLGGLGFDFPVSRAFDIPRHYRSPGVPRDDAGHRAAAEAKRQRKAERRAREGRKP